MTNEKFEYEIKTQEFWEENNIYEKVKEKNKDGKPFNFVEGPPYPTGEAHLGHLRNWAIKDSVLRLKRFQGYNVYAKDGYDCHGLPVENKVQKKLGIETVDKLKEFGVDKFIQECKSFANGIVNDMGALRTRYGFWMDRENPYLTFHPDYVSLSWKFFEIAEKKNLLYKDYRTVGWCPHDETTLSDYELKDEYKVLSDPSIYVKFPIKDANRTTKYEESLVIWTTTPWTLQSNMAIAVNPKYEYAKVLVKINGKEEVLILAKSLIKTVIDKLSTQIDIEFVEILETIIGAELEGIKYEHIYLDETPSQQEFVKLDHKHIHSVVLADYVTLDEGEDLFDKLDKRSYKHSNTDKKEEVKKDTEEIADGTGLVHIAPGHGFDDYDVGKKYNLPIFCPVDEGGNLNEGKYKGTYFKDVDPIAIKYLTEKGYMLYNKAKSHRYPCCWRCKTPIVYRATEQWYIKRSQQTKGVIKANSNVKWFPKSARQSFDNLRENAGDWAISRQRFWSIPMPVWEDEQGNYKVFGSKEDLEKNIGHKLDDIHLDDLKDIIVKGDNGQEMRHIGLTTDVWYESGCASFASHYGEGLSFDQIIKKYYPMSWITEGEDQIRGWFSSLFNVGYTVTDKAPYNQVLFQSFVMDKNGVKMSKSLGNGITGNESIERFGSDASRYYLLTKIAPEAKLNFDLEEFSLINGFFNTLENLTKFMNSYLNEHKLKDEFVNTQGLDVEDKWILYKLSRTIETYTNHFEHFRLNQAFESLETFIVKDLSKTYLKLIKERTEERDDTLLTIFAEILKKILIMISTAIPFKAEELYQNCNLPFKKESIFLEDLPQSDQLLIKEIEKKGINANFDLAQDIIQATLNAREKVKIGVRWPLGQIDLVSSDDLKVKIEPFEKLIKKLVNVSKINYDLNDVEINYVIKPNFPGLKQSFENPKDAIKAINMNKFYIGEDIKKGELGGTYEGVSLDFDKHIIKEIELKGELISSEFNKGSVILHTHQDEILLEEGYLRELIRRIQSMRKDLGLHKNDEISLSFSGSDKYFIELSRNWTSVISKKVGASEILDNTLDESKEFEIKEKKLIVSIKKN